MTEVELNTDIDVQVVPPFNVLATKDEAPATIATVLLD
jgi:hypothetical protein